MFFYGCIDTFGDRAFGFRLLNNSGIKIEAYASFIYPDTTLMSTKPEFKSLNPGRSAYIFDADVSKESLSRFYDNGEIITVFIFNTDTLNRYSWDQIHDDYNILKRYEFTWEELKNQGGDLIYPDSDF